MNTALVLGLISFAASTVSISDMEWTLFKVCIELYFKITPNEFRVIVIFFYLSDY